MKKTIVLLICVIVAATLFCGCAGNTGDANQDNKINAASQQSDNVSDNNSSEQKDEIDLDSYKTPAEAVSIDLTKDDPSNDEMRFVFDDEGKVTQCYYKIGDQQIYVNYTYNDGSVQIYAFMGDILVADETIELSAYDAEKGFTVIEGYYFKGFSAKYAK